VMFLSGLPEAPWPENIVSMLSNRELAQEPLLGTMR
jgi:hypothetical protein